MARNGRMSIEQAFAKRFIDIVIAGIACVIASPFMLVTALAVKLQDGTGFALHSKLFSDVGCEADGANGKDFVYEGKYGRDCGWADDGGDGTEYC